MSRAPGGMDAVLYRETFEVEETFWWFVGMRAIVATLLARTPAATAGGWVLDAGCGTGGSYQFLTRYGRVASIDVSEHAIAFSRQRRLPALLQGSVTALPFRDGAFDLVVSFDVIDELWPDLDDRAVAEMARVLRPGGTLLIRVPAYQWLHSRHDRIARTQHRYTRGEVVEKVQRAGLEVRGATYANSLLLPLAVVRRLLGKRRTGGKSELAPLPGWLNAVLTAALRVEAAILKRVSLPAGLSVIVVAGKGGCPDR